MSLKLKTQRMTIHKVMEAVTLTMTSQKRRRRVKKEELRCHLDQMASLKIANSNEVQINKVSN
jgi:hypothetical protein